MLHDAIEEPYCLNGSIKNLQHLKNLSVSQQLLCGERRSLDYKKVRKRCSLTEWFFVEPEMVLQWHRCEEPLEEALFLRVCLFWLHCFIWYIYSMSRKTWNENETELERIFTVNGWPTQKFRVITFGNHLFNNSLQFSQLYNKLNKSQK